MSECVSEYVSEYIDLESSLQSSPKECMYGDSLWW